MEAVKILAKKERVGWDYDEEADVLYLSIGKPRKAVGVDIGDGVVVRYDEKKRNWWILPSSVFGRASWNL